MAEMLHDWILENFFESKVWTDFERHFKNFVEKKYKEPEIILEKVNFTAWVNGIGVSPQQDVLNNTFFSPIAPAAQSLAK